MTPRNRQSKLRVVTCKSINFLSSSQQPFYDPQPSAAPPGPPTPRPPHIHAAYQELKGRSAQDGIWARLYWLLKLVCVGVAAYSAVAKTQLYSLLIKQDDYLDNYTHCPTTLHANEAALAAAAASAAKGDITPDDIRALLQSAGVLLLAALALAATFSFLFIWLLNNYPGVLVFITVAIQVAIPAVFGFWALSVGSTTTGYIAIGVAVALGLSFFIWRDGMRLVTKLLGLSARALRDQPGLIGLTMLLNLALPIVMFAYSLASVTVAASGTVLPNPDRASITPGGHCMSGSKDLVPCCVWQPVPWVKPYAALSSSMLLWTTLLMHQIKVFTVSGAVCQWYWAPMSSLGSCHTVSGATRKSLGHALGPSFGSLCLGSLILFVTATARMFMSRWRQARQSSSPNLLQVLLTCCLGFVFEILEQLTKFAVVRTAMTGQAFVQASRDVVDLLWRNAMDAYSVWWLPPLVLHLASGILSFCLSWGTYLISLQLWTNHGDVARWDAKTAATTLSLITGVTSFLMMSFLSSLLLNVLDAMWICFAVDRDNQCCTRPAVHQAFSQLPSISGSLVVQPTGEYAYAQPSAPPLDQGYPSAQAYPNQPYSGQPYPNQPYPAQPYPGQGPSAPYAQDPRYPPVK